MKSEHKKQAVKTSGQAGSDAKRHVNEAGAATKRRPYTPPAIAEEERFEQKVLMGCTKAEECAANLGAVVSS